MRRIAIHTNLLFTLLLYLPFAAHALEGPLYGIDYSGDLYEIDPSDASLMLVGATGQTSISGGLATHPTTGRLWFGAFVAPSSEVTLVSVDPDSLQTTVEVELVGFGDANTRDLTFLPNGDLYALGHTPGSRGGAELWRIDVSTGVATSVAVSDGTRIGGIAAIDDDTLLGDLGAQVIDLTIGPPHPGPSGSGFTALPTRVTQMTFAADDNDTYVVRGCASVCSGELYRIDLDTKAGSLIGTPSPYIGGIAVPEPDAGSIAGSACAVLAALRVRRSSAASIGAAGL